VGRVASSQKAFSNRQGSNDGQGLGVDLAELDGAVDVLVLLADAALREEVERVAGDAQPAWPRVKVGVVTVNVTLK
jgi:hypothetical protein